MKVGFWSVAAEDEESSWERDSQQVVELLAGVVEAETILLSIAYNS
jgi:hypothetical protein